MNKTWINYICTKKKSLCVTFSHENHKKINAVSFRYNIMSLLMISILVSSWCIVRLLQQSLGFNYRFRAFIAIVLVECRVSGTTFDGHRSPARIILVAIRLVDIWSQWFVTSSMNRFCLHRARGHFVNSSEITPKFRHHGCTVSAVCGRILLDRDG